MKKFLRYMSAVSLILFTAFVCTLSGFVEANANSSFAYVLTANTSASASITSSGTVAYYTFTAPTSGEYVIYSTGSEDTQVTLYNDRSEILDSDDDGGSGLNFRLVYNMTAGTAYRFGIRYYSSSKTGTISFKFGRVFTVTYDANGGTSAPQTQKGDYAAAITLRSEAVTREGYKFLGWSSSSSATSATYSPGETVTLSSDLALYAVWEFEATTLVADCSAYATISSGGEMRYYSFTPTVSRKYVIYSTGSEDTRVYLYNSSGSQKLAENDDGGEGTNFRLEYDMIAGVRYVFGVKFYYSTKAGDITFRFGRVYNITYDANNGTGAPSAQTKDSGKSINLSSSIPVRDGYTFLGWSENRNAATATYSPGSAFSYDSDAVLYAVWHTHSYASSVTKAAECTVDGVKTYTCTGCANSYTEAIPATGHTRVTDNAIEPTCERAGLTEGSHCSACNEVFVAQEAVARKEHTNKTVTAKATLTKNGKTETKCTVCGNVSKTTVIYYPKTIKLSATSYSYDGKVKTPSVTVKDSGGNTLTKDKHYTLKYSSGRKNPGKYTVTVTFKGNRTGSKSLSFTIKPGKVTGCKVTSTTTTIKLSWSKVTGATEYNIYYKSGDSWKLGVKNITGTSHTYTNRKPGEKHSFKIIALAKSGGNVYKGDFSDEFSAATKPAKVTGIKATKHTNTTITLSWKAVSGATGYRVYSYDASTKKYTSLGYVAGKNTLTVKNLKFGSTYNLVVRAYINTTFGAVWGEYSGRLKYTITPAVPDLKAVSSEKNKVTLTWSDISGVSGYEIYWSGKKDSGFKLLTTVKADVTKLKLKNLSSGHTYYFRVRAFAKVNGSTIYSGYKTVSVKIK